MSATLVYIHPTRIERKVRTGFRSPALVFGALWAFSEGLVEQGGKLTAIDAVAALLLTVKEPAAAGLAVVALLLFLAKNIYCGAHASNWLQVELLQSGYKQLT